MLNGSRHYPRELGGTIAGCARLPTPHRLPQPCCGFRGIERGSIPLPVGSSHSRFGTVFRQTYRQALFCIGPFMVELFAAVAFFDGPRTGQSGFACHQAESSPRRPGCTIRRSGPEPPGWDYAVRRLLHPLWSMAALFSKTEQGVSASPSLRREAGDRSLERLIVNFRLQGQKTATSELSPASCLTPPAFSIG